MINLIHAEIYKLRKSTSYKITLLLAGAFSLINYLVYLVYQSGLVDTSSGTNAAILESLSESNILDILRQLFANTNTLIFVTIFLCMFAVSDYRSGAIKNFAGKGFRREKLYLSRFLIAWLGALSIYLLTAFAVLVGGVLCYGSASINGPFFHDFFVFLAMHLLYLTCYTAIILLICEITRNAAGILISVFGVMLLSSPLLSVIDLLAGAMGARFALSDYWIMSLIAGCPITDIPAQFITKSLLVSGVWLAAALAGGMLYHSWHDIN